MNINEEFYKKVLDNLYDGIYFINHNREIIYWNSGAERHTGYKHSEVMGKHCYDNIIMHVDEEGIPLCDKSCPVLQTIADGCVREVEVFQHHKEGHLIPVSLRIAPVSSSSNEIVVAVEIFNETSPKFTLRQKVEELRSMALIDSLTGTGNRRYIEMFLRSRLDEMKRYGWMFGILFIDIDYFKAINDKYGHDAGDRILKMAGKTILNSLRSFDFLGRWGGEEFIVILANVNGEQLYSIANRLRLLVEHSSTPIGTDIVHVTISIGAALALQDDDVHSIIKRADKLMYNSKASGRNCVSTNM